MAIHTNDIRDLVIIPALHALDMHSPEAVELMLGTCAIESDMGSRLVQMGHGPAIGIFQMEPDTYQSLWDDYLHYRPALIDKIGIKLKGGGVYVELMATNLTFAAMMARIKYYPDPRPIPLSLEGQAEYWKIVYNTAGGHGTIAQYILKYRKYVDDGR